jgi:hypothetical protein
LFRAAGAEALQTGMQEVRVLPVVLGLLLNPPFPYTENLN